MARLRKTTTGSDKVKQAEDLWQAALDSISEFVSVHDQDFHILRANKAFIDTIGMPSDQIIGKKCFEVLHGTTDPLPGCPHQRALQNKKCETEEFYEPRLGIYL